MESLSKCTYNDKNYRLFVEYNKVCLPMHLPFSQNEGIIGRKANALGERMIM
jgi:hypothetical protein